MCRLTNVDKSMSFLFINLTIVVSFKKNTIIFIYFEINIVYQLLLRKKRRNRKPRGLYAIYKEEKKLSYWTAFFNHLVGFTLKLMNTSKERIWGFKSASHMVLAFTHKNIYYSVIIINKNSFFKL